MAGKYISTELREAIGNIASRRTTSEIIRQSNNIYEILKKDIETSLNSEGLDLITYTPERKIGKSYSLMKLASEYNMPIIVHSSAWGQYVERKAKELFGRTIAVRSISSNLANLYGLNCKTVLKEEAVDAHELREKLKNVELEHINIVGIN